MLYRLSYPSMSSVVKFLVPAVSIELTTFRLKGGCSAKLSYAGTSSHFFRYLKMAQGSGVEPLILVLETSVFPLY